MILCSTFEKERLYYVGAAGERLLVSTVGDMGPVEQGPAIAGKRRRRRAIPLLQLRPVAKALFVFLTGCSL